MHTIKGRTDGKTSTILNSAGGDTPDIPEQFKRDPKTVTAVTASLAPAKGATKLGKPAVKAPAPKGKAPAKAPAKDAAKDAPSAADAPAEEAAKAPAAKKGKAPAAKVAAPAKEKAPAVGRGTKKDAAPAVKTGAGVGRASAIDGKRKLTLVTKENPHREGTLAYKTFGFYKGAKTVAAFRDACAANGGDANYLKFHVEKGHVTLD